MTDKTKALQQQAALATEAGRLQTQLEIVTKAYNRALEKKKELEKEIEEAAARDDITDEELEALEARLESLIDEVGYKSKVLKMLAQSFMQLVQGTKQFSIALPATFATPAVQPAAPVTAAAPVAPVAPVSRQANSAPATYMPTAPRVPFTVPVLGANTSLPKARQPMPLVAQTVAKPAAKSPEKPAAKQPSKHAERLKNMGAKLEQLQSSIDETNTMLASLESLMAQNVDELSKIRALLEGAEQAVEKGDAETAEAAAEKAEEAVQSQQTEWKTPTLTMPGKSGGMRVSVPLGKAEEPLAIPAEQTRTESAVHQPSRISRVWNGLMDRLTNAVSAKHEEPTSHNPDAEPTLEAPAAPVVEAQPAAAATPAPVEEQFELAIEDDASIPAKSEDESLPAVLRSGRTDARSHVEEPSHNRVGTFLRERVAPWVSRRDAGLAAAAAVLGTVFWNAPAAKDTAAAFAGAGKVPAQAYNGDGDAAQYTKTEAETRLTLDQYEQKQNGQKRPHYRYSESYTGEKPADPNKGVETSSVEKAEGPSIEIVKVKKKSFDLGGRG